MEKYISLAKEFYTDNEIDILTSISSSILSEYIDSNVLPNVFLNFFDKDTKEYFIKNVLKFSGIYSVKKGLEIVSDYTYNKIGPLLTKFLTEKMMNAVFIKYASTHIPVNTAIILDKIDVIKDAFKDIFTLILFRILSPVVTIFINLMAIFTQNTSISICISICIIIIVTYIYYVFICGNDNLTEHVATNDILYYYIENVFNNIEMIFSTKDGIDNENKYILELDNNVIATKLKKNKKITNTHIIGYAIIIILLTVILIYTLYEKNEISFKFIKSNFFPVRYIFYNMFNILYYMTELMTNIQTLMANEKFIEELFSYKLDTTLLDIPIFNNGSIQVNNVTFSYDETRLFENFNLNIENNDKIAFYGMSGSGKSTLTKLIMGWLKPKNGNILINGIDISTINNTSICNCISYVPQNSTLLFKDTIYENIIYGMTDTPELKNKVLDLINTYSLNSVFGCKTLDSHTGRYGSTLSGGQKQLIHLLRVIINNNSKILILDEPTSAMDIESKLHIISMISNINKTIIIITHDSLVKNSCNKTLSFINGMQVLT
jgi:ABC-type multidrug transport system fused ATPase/permease subunit